MAGEEGEGRGGHGLAGSMCACVRVRLCVCGVRLRALVHVCVYVRVRERARAHVSVCCVCGISSQETGKSYRKKTMRKYVWNRCLFLYFRPLGPQHIFSFPCLSPSHKTLFFA